MAHLSEPVLHLDVEHGEGTSTQCNHPPDLVPFLPKIMKLEPDGGKIHYLRTAEATLTIWKKNETRTENLHGVDWYDPQIPVQSQGPHESCWSTSGSENISDACYYNSINVEYVPYSGQYLLDFVSSGKAKKRYVETKGRHYCYGYPIFRGLLYAMEHGIPRRADWTGTGCGTKFVQNRNLGEVRLKHVLNDVRSFTDVNKALHYLKIQPILGSLAVFNPELRDIGKGIYRGPTLEDSTFDGWHSVSLRSIKMENGETIGYVKNSHGTERGDAGYVKVSLDIMIFEWKTTGIRSFRRPGRLFRSFVYGEVRPAYEKEVVECYVDGHKIDHQVTRSKDTTLFILEGIFHNTSGHVFQCENGQNEVIGSPIDRAMFKWAIQLQLNMNFTYSKSGSTTIKGSPCNSKPKCLGIAVDCHKTYKSGVRIHWKGNATFILGKCTKYDSNGEFLEMSKTKKTQLEDAIDDMAARNLICIALAYKEFEWTNLPRPKKRQRWRLPCEDLVLLAIFGIKNPCLLGEDDHEKQAPLDFEEHVEEDASKAHLANLVDLVDSTICPSISEGLKKFGDVEGIMDEEIGNEAPAQDDASVSAAIIAVNLLSSARLMLKLDNVYTEYSAQYLVDNACPKKEAGQGETDHHCPKLTVKDGLKFALKEGIPKEEDWPHLGCMFNRPSSSCNAARISMKGEVMETVSVNEALELLTHQPVGAKLHVFSPDIDLLGDGIYIGPSCEKSCYVGLRNVIIYGATQMDGHTVASVKMCYGNKVAFIKVSLEVVSLQLLKDGCSDVNDGISKPGSLLVDFCLPRLSIE